MTAVKQPLIANGAYQLPEKLKLPLHLRTNGHGLPFLALDTETTGENFHKPLPGCLQAARPWLVTAHAYDPTTRTLTPHLFRGRVDPRTRTVTWPTSTLARLRKLLLTFSPRRGTRSRPYVFHNALFDLPALRSIGVDLLPDVCEDTLAASHVLDSSEPHGLKDLAIRYLDILDTDEIILKAKTEQAQTLAQQHGYPLHPEYKANTFLIDHFFASSEAEDYGMGDTRRTALLWLMQETILAKKKRTTDATGPDWSHYHREQRVMVTTDHMTRHPIHIRPEARQILAEHRAHCDQYDLQTQSLANTPGNLRSPVYMRQTLYDHFQLPVISHTAKTRSPATDAFTLSQLSLIAETSGNTPAMQFIESLMTYRAYAYAVSIGEGYFSRSLTLLKRDWLYGHFNPWAAITTRYSASDPNLQSVKKESDDGISTRSYFGPPPGWWWISFDFNQLELRLMARASGDPVLLKILNDGLDQHQRTADAINTVLDSLGLPHVSRKVGKAVNFAWQYGAKARKLARMSGIPLDNATELEEAMRDSYPLVCEYMETTSRHVRQHGLVRTLFGYPIHVRPSLNPYTGDMEPADYVGTNYVIQGTAGDICKNSMIAIHEYLIAHKLTGRAHLLMTIHDEIILEVKRGFPRKHIHAISKILHSAGLPIDCPTPAKASLITTHWGETQPL